MNPVYTITIGSLTIDSTRLTAGGLPFEVILDLRLNAINAAEIKLHLPSPGSIAPGNPVTIEVGEDNKEKVFAGTAQEIKKEIQSTAIHGQSSMASLANRRVNKLYEKQKAGDIVNDLAQTAGLATARVEIGLDYPVYTIGDNRSVFEHILELSRRNGFDVYTNSEDKLVFAKYAPGTVHPFQFGVNIIELHLNEKTAPVEGVEVYGESPSSLGQGGDAYSWLTKKEVKGTAGTTSGNVLRLSDPALKDLEAAGAAAKSILGPHAKTKSGFLKALGNAKVQLGDAIQISAIPDSSINGTYKVTRVKHILSKLIGFTTTIYWTEA